MPTCSTLTVGQVFLSELFKRGKKITMNNTVISVMSVLALAFSPTISYASNASEAEAACSASSSDIPSDVLATGCSCMVEAASGDGDLIDEILSLSELGSDAERMEAASSELSDIIGQCFEM